MKMLIFFIKKPLETLSYGIIYSLFSAIFLLSVNPATAAESSQYNKRYLEKKRIEQRAVDYVQALFPPPELGEISYQAVPLDRRIKIKPCDSELQLSIPGTATLTKRTTVLVRCPANASADTVAKKSWNLYVQVKIIQLVPVVVALTSLSPGVVIDHSNVTVMLKDKNQIRGRTLQRPNLLFGAKASRHVSAGQPVTLKQVCLVCKGDSVTIIAKIKGLSVKTSGISQQNGSLGDNIAILNTRSSKRIDARVVAVNRVEISI